MNSDIPKTYDEQHAPEDFLREQKETDDTHDSEESEEIKEKVYIDTCEECGRHLFTEVEALGYDDREMFKCGYKTLRVNGKILCPSCILTAFWVNGKSSITIGGIMEDKNLVVREAIVMPAVSKEKAVEAFKAYQDLAKEIMTPDDIQKIQGKDFKKKSFWRKCQRFFNLSLEKREERREDNNGVISYHLTYRATAPNGTFVDGCGSCSTNEKGLLKTEHNTRAIAETRSKNRAISDLVAFGEVSAEEIVSNGHEEPLNISDEEIEKVLDDEAKKPLDNIETPLCIKCNGKLTPKVYNYSLGKFGKALCFNCQPKK